MKFYNKIRIYLDKYKNELDNNFLLFKDWDVLRRLERYLELFKRATKQVEGYTNNNNHEALWETLFIIKYLLKHLESLKEIIPKKDTRI